MLKAETVEELPSEFKVLIYGPPGGGKTKWVAENVPKPLWIDFEKSTETLKKFPEHKDIRVTRVGADENPQAVVEYVKKEVRSGSLDTLVLDTISTSQLFQLTDLVRNSNHDLALIQDYRVSTNFFGELFYWLQSQPIHVVLIAHEKDFYEGELSSRKKVATGPNVTPALHEAVRQLVNGVFRFEAVTKGLGKNAEITHRQMLVNAQGLYVAKNRYNVQELIVENPTWDTFMKGID